MLRHLGKGAAGMVNLIRSKKTGEQFALKTINLLYLSEKDKRSAESEVEFLRVITGPTIIKFYESFKENNDIYIVMEYAEGGSLAQLIQKHVMSGKRFTEEQIVMYAA
jgi:NIMA (never in mitosis gene a)-related kinase